jgi:hypothetical protein
MPSEAAAWRERGQPAWIPVLSTAKFLMATDRCCAGILLGIIRGKGPLRPGLAPRQDEDILSSYMAPAYTCASSTASAGPPGTSSDGWKP